MNRRPIIARVKYAARQFRCVKCGRTKSVAVDQTPSLFGDGCRMDPAFVHFYSFVKMVERTRVIRSDRPMISA
jgi:hypothetical protein